MVCVWIALHWSEMEVKMLTLEIIVQIQIVALKCHLWLFLCA